MRRAAVALVVGLAVVLGGCGVTLEDEPEPYGPATESPSPAPTVSVRPDDLPVDEPTSLPAPTPTPTPATPPPTTRPDQGGDA